MEFGLAASLARPGGNVTGVQTLQSELAAKDLSLLKEVVPGLSRSGILVPAPFSSPFATALLREAASAGKALGIHLQIVRIQSPDELEKAFSAFRAERAQGVLVVRSQYLSIHSKTVADIALRHHLPTVSDSPAVPRNGGLISYGFDPRGTVRSAAEIVDSILRGARASETPIRQAATFQFVINLKTAKALGLTIPPSLLQWADQGVTESRWADAVLAEGQTAKVPRGRARVGAHKQIVVLTITRWCKVVPLAAPPGPS